MHNYTTILFDLDGTLIDSKPGVLWSVRNALNDLRLPVPDDAQLTTFMGPPIRLCFTEVCGLTDQQADATIARFRHYYEGEGLYNCSVYAGVELMLSAMGAAGLRLGVATSKAEKFAVTVLENKKILSYFETVAGAPINDHRATKKDSILHALAAMGLPPQQFDTAVLIGDRKFDAEGAALAGIQSIGVTYGYGSMQELQSSFNICCSSPAQLTELLCGTRPRAPLDR